VSETFAKLPDASWRGVAFPFVGTRDFGFGQEQQGHRYIFRDQQLIESIGRTNPTYRYTIPFREFVRRGWSGLFVDVYPKFLEACLDRSAGVLVDPVHGQTRAKCVSFAETLEVTKSDGVDVVAEFVYSPESDDDKPTSFANIAQTLDRAAVAAVNFGAAAGTPSRAEGVRLAALSEDERREEQSYNAPAKRATVNILQAARAFADSASGARDRTRAQLQDATLQLEQTREAIDNASDPQAAAVRKDASRLELASRRLSETTARSSRPSRVVRVTADTGRMALAVLHGISIDDLLAHNPHLAGLPVVPVGYELRLPRRDG
jgi:hypothetical protein